MEPTNITRHKLTDAVAVLSINIATPSNVIIEGTFGGGTVTHRMKGTTTAIRTPSTSADTYRNVVQENVFTLTGSTGADIDIVIETTKIR